MFLWVQNWDLSRIHRLTLDALIRIKDRISDLEELVDVLVTKIRI